MTRNFPTTLLNLKNKVARHVLPDPRTPPPPFFHKFVSALHIAS